jgi:glycosyltransferase involved in cell wall biosynthesis
MRQALDSVLSQSYDNLEVIISDNCSTDGTASIGREYVQRDSRVRYHRNDTNVGLTCNLRRVLELASGEYFMWACADDIRPPDTVEKCLKALLNNEGAIMAYGPVLMKCQGRRDVVEVTNEMNLSDRRPTERIRNFTNGLTSQCIVYGLFRRSVMSRGIFPESYGQEYLFCLQMLTLGRLVFVRTPMIIYQLRKPVLTDNPMYLEVPITIGNLLKTSGIVRRKCWTVLIFGCYYMFRLRTIPLIRRLSAIRAHAFPFIRLYRRRLAKEIIFQLFVPIAFLCQRLWRLSRQWDFSFRLACKLRTALDRSPSV